MLGLSAWSHLGRGDARSRAWGAVEAALALALLAGAWTQVAALIALAWFGASLFVRDMRIFAKSTMILAFLISISLLVTGPGAFAFDLPL